MPPKSHHYNPQVYLRRFVNPAAKNKLWEFDLRQGTARLSSPKNSGCEDYYHSFETVKGRDDASVEKSFSELENKLQKLFEVIRNKRPLSPEVWATLFLFAALQRARCPKMVNSLQNHLSEVYSYAFQIAKHSGGFDAAMKERGLDTELIRSTEPEITAARGLPVLMSLAANNGNRLAHTFARMGWGFLIAPPGMYFWTTDDPVCCWANREQNGFLRNAVGPANSNAEITFPLSRRVCAFGSWATPQTELYVAISPELVNTINLRNVSNGWRFAYGPTNVPEIRGLVENIAKSRATH